MSFFCRLSRKHYWGTPHRSADNRLIQVCYECGAERPARELHNDFSIESFDNLLAADRAREVKAYPRPIEQQISEPVSRAPVDERIAVGQRPRKFFVIK